MLKQFYEIGKIIQKRMFWEDIGSKMSLKKFKKNYRKFFILENIPKKIMYHPYIFYTIETIGSKQFNSLKWHWSLPLIIIKIVVLCLFIFSK